MSLTIMTDSADRRLPDVAHPVRLLTAMSLILLPVLLCGAFIKSYGVNVVFWDEWWMIDVFDKWYAGTLGMSDLLAQHNEHRIFFPRLLILILGHFTGFNTYVNMWASWAALGVIATLYFLLMSSPAANFRSSLAQFIPISWLIFNWGHHENLLWGFQICVFLMLLGALGAIYLLSLDDRSNLAYGGAILSGLVSSFSFANGLFIWPVGVIQLAAQHYLREGKLTARGWRRTTIWGLTGAAVWGGYFLNYYKPSRGIPSLLFALKEPLAAINFFLVYLGLPVSNQFSSWDPIPSAVSQGTAAGMALATAGSYIFFLILFKQKLGILEVRLLSLNLFAILSAAVIVFSRGGLEALPPRYLTLSAFGLCALYALALRIESARQRLPLLGFLAGLIFFGVAHSYLQGAAIGRAYWARRGEMAFWLRSYPCQEDARLLQLFPLSANLARELAQRLEKHHLNVFHESQKIDCGPDRQPKELLSRQGGTDYSIESISQTAGESLVEKLTSDETKRPTLELSGWAVDRESGGPAASVLVNVDGRRDFPTDYGRERMDVALHFNRPAYWHSGFAASLPVAELGPGKHTVRLKIVTPDRRQYYLSEPAIVEVIP
jgi:hypothetical protein